MDSVLGGLEQKLAALLADYHRLRAENESLKRELGRAQEQQRSLAARMAAATARLDSLLEELSQWANGSHGRPLDHARRRDPRPRVSRLVQGIRARGVAAGGAI